MILLLVSVAVAVFRSVLLFVLFFIVFVWGSHRAIQFTIRFGVFVCVSLMCFCMCTRDTAPSIHTNVYNSMNYYRKQTLTIELFRPPLLCSDTVHHIDCIRTCPEAPQQSDDISKMHDQWTKPLIFIQITQYLDIDCVQFSTLLPLPINIHSKLYELNKCR